MTENKISKANICPDDIKANIYNSIELYADIEGVTEQDISDLEKSFATFFDNKLYKFDKTEMYIDELREYANRNNLQYTRYQEQHFLNQENVLRYKFNDYTEQVNICTKFISIKLDYELNHKLNSKIDLLIKIIDCFKTRKYFKLASIGIKERDSVVCETLYKLYRCFDKTMFGDAGYQLSRNGKKVNLFQLKNSSIFQLDSYNINLNKEVIQGMFEDKTSYMGVLEMEVMMDVDNLTKLSEIFNNMKTVCFNIFLEHITDFMLKSLVNGENKLIKEGFHKNE